MDSPFGITIRVLAVLMSLYVAYFSFQTAAHERAKRQTEEAIEASASRLGQAERRTTSRHARYSLPLLYSLSAVSVVCSVSLVIQIVRSARPSKPAE